MDYSTGESRPIVGGMPQLQLFHHTKDDVKPLIEDSKVFLASKWNIQGNKELVNVSYVYFTCLDEIKKRQDLQQIAMATNGKIYMIKDGVPVPQPLHESNWKEQHGDDVLEIEVYRESTTNRTATLTMLVGAELLASQHVLFHRPPGEPAYYEVSKPFIQRVGLKPGAVLHFDEGGQCLPGPDVIYFDHVVAGDATTLKGLAAPFDEEGTEDIFKVERTGDGDSIVSFWFVQSNQDHFSGKPLTPYEFKDTDGDK